MLYFVALSLEALNLSPVGPCLKFPGVHLLLIVPFNHHVTQIMNYLVTPFGRVDRR